MKRKLFKGVIFTTIILMIGYIFAFAFFPEVYLNHLYQIEIVNQNDLPLYSIIQSGISDYVSLDQISDEFKTTLITVEDKRFYSHNGLDYPRIAKSFFENAKSNQLSQGGSTITQQLARMAYLDNSKTYQRKIKEAIIAKKIEKKYNKNQILEMYINNCYFAHNLYGIQSASAYYFNKLPKELNYSESALLVGIINAPNLYAPDIDYQEAIKKQEQILYLLLENNIINTTQYYEELNRPLNLYLKSNQSQNNLMYYQDAINNQLDLLKIKSKNNLRQGIKVKTYLDVDIYNQVNTIVQSHRNDTKNGEISVVIMKPYSGEVLSLIGGFDYNISPFNRALNSKRQIGSTIKPLIYYLGLKEGMTPLSKFTSEQTTFNIEGIGTYSPKNANDSYANRKINMVEAISLSDNIYAVKTTLLIGSNKIQSLLKDFNISCEQVNPTIGLGSISLTPLELTSIYNCFASEGIYYAPSFINEIRLSDNTLLKKISTKNKMILDQYQTLIINHLLKSPFDTSLASYSYPSLGNYQTNSTFAAKTGSTSSTNWVIGFNKNYTIGIYVGNDDNDELDNKKLARILFKEIANKLTENDVDSFYEPTSKMTSFTFYNSLNNKKSKVYYR